PFPKESHVYNAIAQHIPFDAEMYNTCWQNQELIVPKLEFFNKNLYFVVIVSSIFLIITIALPQKKLSKKSLFFVLLTFIFIVINNIDCASFAQVNGRYGCRVMWLLPFCAMMLLSNLNRSDKQVF